MATLIDCTNGRGRGEFAVNKDRMVIGSKAASEIPLANLNADSEHAVIIRCGELYVIEDLGSATGTFVNERQIARLLLSDGDVISIGNCQLRFVEEDAKAAAAPAAKGKAPVPEADKPAQAPQARRNSAPVVPGPVAGGECPHCSYKRQDKDSKAPADRCPSCKMGYGTKPGALMSAESKTGDRLEVYDKEVVIRRKMGVKVLLQSLKGDLLEGIKGDKYIPIDSIASIQLKPASALLAGYITVVLPESKEGFKLAGLDDCTVEFVKREEGKFVEIKAFLDARIGR